MDASNPISAAVFSAFIKCPTKAHLLAIGEPAPGAYFADMEARIASLYKAAVQRRLRVGAEGAEPIDFGELWRSPDYATVTHEVDCETAVYDFALPQHKPRARQPRESPSSGPFVPVLFSPWDKPILSDKLLVCFGALSLLQATGMLRHRNTDLWRQLPQQNREDRRLRRRDAPDHQRGRGDLPQSGAAPAHFEQTLRRLRLSA
jgi:hypothetical protein